MNIAFYSVTGQTQRFVQKTGLPATEIDDANPLIAMNAPYILIVPSYDDYMMDAVIDFLGYQNNAHWLKGVAGGGNRNFNDLYIHTAKDIARGLAVSVIFDFEFNGTPSDVQNFKKAVQAIESKIH
ncbi:class Ib ribonucleoside-diphosphate reductase assembly flavoprotein NrdI [Bombilactobacillus thymidiniphilus]|uniref:Class Ib ribonucleoside-diphosphate reductase assembly flavoprotein NrdI n=1 Tax=Bombilactobacillus thymidiniphilus TaxID=2923363 RepID=A0ABY4PFI4_9LACO|nr:class Ib ribonucleoside-diphosphate reductase assembly flavoprotein NrdI [Bombilactobacillus thymidiniphilus]UQS84345.1 class Ib ribonucleoside-diphosphate reductase assembly flavoprotein NrdI [Bombilactobacillus thymidiniphilus]